MALIMKIIIVKDGHILLFEARGGGVRRVENLFFGTCRHASTKLKYITT